MPMLPNLFRLALLLSLLFNCCCKNSTQTQSTTSEPEVIVENPTFQKKTVEKKIGNCDTDNNCLEVTTTYPILTGVQPDIQEKINNSILEEVILTMELEDDVKLGPFAVDSAAQQWVEAYKEYLNEDIQDRVAMTFQLDGKGTIYKHYAVTELPVSTYTGGAHPNYLSLFSNYNLNTGELIELEDIVTDSIAFKKIVETAFQKAIKEKGTEADRGSYFWGKPFYLPANYSITKKGLYFLYNPYEIAAYVYGTTEFTVSYKDLEGAIKLP